MIQKYEVVILILIGIAALGGMWLTHSMRKDEDEDSETTSAEERAAGLGDRLGGILAQIVIIPSSVVYRTFTSFGRVLVSSIPFVRGSFWRGMIKFCTHQYQKSTNADVVNFLHTPTGVEPRATNWNEGSEDLGDERGWKIRGTDTVIKPGTEGRDTERMGKANIIFSDTAVPFTASPFQLAVSEALDLENVEGLIQGANVNVSQIDVWPKDPGSFDAASGDALADGGAELVDRQTEMTVHASEAGLADAVVTLDDKTRISMRKWKDTLLEMVGTEELEKAEDRGFLSGLGKDGTGEAAGIIKGLLIAGGVFIAYEVGPVAIRALFGGGGTGGGSGGGGLPFLMAHATDLVTGVV